MFSVQIIKYSLDHDNHIKLNLEFAKMYISKFHQIRKSLIFKLIYRQSTLNQHQNDKAKTNDF